MAPFSSSFIARMKELLTARFSELEAELSHMEDEANGTTEGADSMQVGDSEDDNAQEMAELSNLIAIKETLDKELIDIKKALKRIDEGTYGVCTHCKEPIDERRLEARPASSSCVACKKSLKQEL